MHKLDGKPPLMLRFYRYIHSLPFGIFESLLCSMCVACGEWFFARKCNSEKAFLRGSNCPKCNIDLAQKVAALIQSANVLLPDNIEPLAWENLAFRGKERLSEYVSSNEDTCSLCPLYTRCLTIATYEP